MTTIAAAAPAIAMLACFACLAGGSVLIVRRRDVRKGVLMLVMAAVLLGNVLIWTV
ncbi:MAG TPA: hypothetical protein VF695_02255 [Sphingomonas sp.]|jgi:hypothetical protein